MARVRPRTAAAVLVATLLVSAAGGYALSRANDDDTELDASMDTPGTFLEPNPGLPTAPQLDGDPLPDIAVADLAGNDVSFADLVGQPLVVNIWFSTCVPCRQEMPAFGEIHRELGDEVRFIGLNYLETAEAARRFADEYGAGYEQLLDQGGDFTNELKIGNFPATLFIGANGRIVDLHQGAFDADELRSAIQEKLLP